MKWLRTREPKTKSSGERHTFVCFVCLRSERHECVDAHPSGREACQRCRGPLTCIYGPDTVPGRRDFRGWERLSQKYPKPV